jgi:branched-chain amino acid transport system ATP-binding protein
MTAPAALGLCVRDLCVSYGRVQAVHDVSFTVPSGACLGVIGANGAGKSSTLKAIFRLAEATAGELSYQGVALLRTPAHRIGSLGIGYVPEGRRVFAGLTVRKNLLMGGYRLPWRGRGEIADRLAHAYELFPALKQFEGRLAGALSGGQQQMLAIARALIGGPRLLVLDEPSMGLAPVVIEDIARSLGRLRQEGVGLLLVEQNARLTFSLTDRCLVLENGRGVKEGPSEVLRDDPDVRRIYLGR